MSMNIRRSFEKIHAKFASKKSFFKEITENWRQDGCIKKYEKASDLLLNLEKYDQEIQSNFLLTSAEGAFDELLLRKQIKIFKNSFNELCQLTKPMWQQWVEAFCIALLLAFIMRNIVFGFYHVPSGAAEPTILIGDRLWANKMIYFFESPKRGDLVVFDNPEFGYDKSNWLKRWWQHYIGIDVPFFGIKSGPFNEVRRIIGIPGDVIEGRLEDSHPVIYVNKKRLNESYINYYPLIRVKKSIGFVTQDYIGPFKVPRFLKRNVYQHIGVGCSYDSSKTFDLQPFYKLDDCDIVRNSLSGQPILTLAGIPSYEYTLPEGIKCIDQFGPFTVPAGKYWVMGDNRKNSRDSRYWMFLDGSLIHGRVSFITFSLDSCESFWMFDLLKHPVDFWTDIIRWNRCGKRLNNGSDKY